MGKCDLQPYDDSEGFCTIGWGHLIKKAKCANIQNDASFQTFKNGVSQATADSMLKEDVKTAEDIIHDVAGPDVPA
jgi:GH24 family phage-related lysozyme (muramidase)